ncbi:hypothetical protein BCR33DRAFT_723866 [Rhizoclosmatium globosum]|uniref:Cyclic nucleotide-binding domain-containing protein n=1 Tax=Rhizoclosmatium globosum TaxID=329046 RepID=A0A1Y2BAG2_9FUNG|nr:hypothetical protein BCR33DRAFT_723866 [Rhizoclosmatium globosum]|eukprot:ORY31510.1 hypothetical protein BCR33DRAFT_723866 [Rhizoclosmatium globosum]
MEFQEYLEGVKGRVHGVPCMEAFGGSASKRLDGGQRVHYVILDCSLVKGVDFSALQGFQRLKEFTASQGVQLIFCSMGKLGDTISKSGIFDKHFDVEAGSVELPILYQSSRDSYLHKKKIAPHSSISTTTNPAGILVDIFQSHIPDTILGTKSDVFLGHVIQQFFTLVQYTRGEVVWKAGDVGDCLLVVETGSFSSMRGGGGDEFGSKEKGSRSYLPGSMVGEIELFAATKHTGELVCTLDESTAWKMTRDDFQRLCQRYPEFSVPFLQICLRYSKQ